MSRYVRMAEGCVKAHICAVAILAGGGVVVVGRQKMDEVSVEVSVEGVSEATNLWLAKVMME